MKVYGKEGAVCVCVCVCMNVYVYVFRKFENKNAFWETFAYNTFVLGLYKNNIRCLYSLLLCMISE